MELHLSCTRVYHSSPVLVEVLISLALCDPPKIVDACPALDQVDASLGDRKTALVACAAAAQKSPLDYLLDLVDQLPPLDRRSEVYGDLIAQWESGELANSSIASKLIAILNREGASASAKVVALRALAAMPLAARPEPYREIVQVEVEISTLPSQMAYDRKDFSVAPGALVHLSFHNPDALEHNLLIVAPNSLAEMGLAGDRMGQTAEGKLKEYVPNSTKVLAVMGLVGPGKSKSFWFVAPTKPGTYPYVCTVPSHWRTMNGKMKVVAPAAPTKAP